MHRCQDEQPIRDRLTGALIALARVTDGNEHLISESSTAAIAEGLAATASDGGSDSAALEALLRRVTDEKRKMVPDCFTCAAPCGKNDDYDMEKLWNAPAEIRSLKSLLLAGIRDMAARGCRNERVDRFFYRALTAVSMDDFGPEQLLPIVAEMNELEL